MYALVRKKRVVAQSPLEHLLRVEAQEGDLILPIEVADIKPGHEDDRTKGRYSVRGDKVVYTRNTRKLEPDELKARRTKYRGAAYPAVGEQLDAIWKVLAAMGERVGGLQPPEAQAMLERIQAVKKENP